MTTKTLAYLFFFLTLLYIPVLAFYYGGKDASLSSNVLGYRDLQSYFLLMSLGNIGQTTAAAGETNLQI